MMTTKLTLSVLLVCIAWTHCYGASTVTVAQTSGANTTITAQPTTKPTAPSKAPTTKATSASNASTSKASTASNVPSTNTPPASKAPSTKAPTVPPKQGLTTTDKIIIGVTSSVVGVVIIGSLAYTIWYKKKANKIGN